jgi:hypothetical protein
LAQPINFTSPARAVPLHLRMRLCTIDFFSINALLHADTQDLALSCAVLCHDCSAEGHAAGAPHQGPDRRRCILLMALLAQQRLQEQPQSSAAGSCPVR